MFSLTDIQKRLIEGRIDQLFMEMSYGLLGQYASDSGSKNIIFTTQHPVLSLAELYRIASDQDRLNPFEADGIKGMMRTAQNYLTSLNFNAKADVVHEMESYFQTQKIKKEPVDWGKVQSILGEKMDKLKSDMALIVDSEASKVRTVGLASQITKVAQSHGTTDPTIYFMTMRDEHVCKFCKQNHLMPDLITPRLYKMSELKSGYLTQQDRKDGKVSLSLQHPHCRCALTYMPLGMTFVNGLINWHSVGHDEYKVQRGL
jgi:hypothetical protein